MRAILAWLILYSAAFAQRVEPGVPPGWTVYVVHASWCAPCQRFRRDYNTITEFRGPLESAYSVKSCDWERNNDQRFARRFGVSSLPGFIVFRDGVHQYSFVGYNGDWKAFLARLNLDVEGAGESQEERGTPPKLARPITPEERELPRISAMESEILRLRKLIENATKAPPEFGSGKVSEAAKEPKQPETTAGASPTEKPARPDIPGGNGLSPLPPVLSIPAGEAPAGGGQSVGSGVGAEWAKVGAAVLALAAPQFAIPAGALSAAATAFQMLRKRRQALQQQQPQRQTVIERPIPVAMPAMPQPAQVVTQNQYVPIETDTTAEALAWATRQMVHQYPGTEGAVAMLSSLIEQHKAAQSGGKANGHK